MKLADLTQSIKDLLQTNFPNVPVLCEDKGDIDFEAENALAKQGIYMLIRIPQLVNQGLNISDKLVLTATSMLIQVSENVPVNRHRTDYISANQLSLDVAEYLVGQLKSAVNLTDIVIDYVDGLLIATISFETTFNIK